MRVLENYLTAVRSYLPNNIKQDVLDELRENLLEQIGDKSDEIDRDLSESEVAQLLGKMGHPAIVASNFSTQQYLIGPTLYPSYLQIIKYAAVALFLIQIVFSVVTSLAFESFSFSLFGFMFDTLDSIIFGIACITIGFALMEHYGQKLSLFKSWDPQSLLTKARKIASRQDSITSLVTDSVLLIWWNDWFGLANDIVYKANGFVIEAGEVYTTLYWPINILLAISILTYAWILLVNYWTPITNELAIALDLAAVAILVVLIQTKSHFSFEGPERANAIFEHISDYGLPIFFVSILLFVVWDLFSHLKTLKSLRQRSK